MARKTTLRIGTVSEGTLLLHDLIGSLLWDLDRIRLTRAERQTCRSIARNLDAYDDETADDDARDTLSEDWQTLCDIADSHVPDFCYFGSIDGDGACIGVWPMVESVEQSDDVFRGNDTYPSDHARAELAPFAYFEHVNDHGNITLYQRVGRAWREVWSVV